MGKMEVKVTNTHRGIYEEICYPMDDFWRARTSVTATDSSEEKQPYLSNESRFANVMSIESRVPAITDSRYIGRWALTLVPAGALAFHIHRFRGRMLQGNSTHKLTLQLWKEMSLMGQVFWTWEMEIISYL